MKDSVTAEIKEKNIRMRSRWYFVLQRGLAITGVGVVFLIILFAASFIIFAVRENGGTFAAGYGVGGFTAFVQAVPWSVLLVSLALILILGILLQRYAFVYHQPFLYLLLFLIIVVSLAALFIAATPFHQGIFNYATQSKLPLVEGLYEYETAPPSAGGIYRGQVTGYAQNGFVMQNIYDTTSTVLAPAGIQFSPSTVAIGDSVIVFGHRSSSGTIVAVGFEKIIPQ
jgi:hypothetical protein